MAVQRELFGFQQGITTVGGRLERDYKKYLYFVDGSGNVSRKSKSGEGNRGAGWNGVSRDNQFLYFVDKEGDVARSPRAGTERPKK